ncbi:MAG: caspase family protein, partial [Tabrizicola sp.]
DPGHYGSEQRLFGCHNDAQAMARIAEEAGYDSRTVLLDGQATVRAVRDHIAAAAAELKAGEIFLLTYAGHGASIPDFSGDETDDGRDETWCLFDRMLIDDEIYEGWRHFREGVRVLVISDSCHSATVLRATVGGIVPGHGGAAGRPRTLPDEVRRAVITAHQATYRAAALAVGAGEGGILKPGRSRAISQPLDCTVRLLSGCMDNQTSGDGELNGLFTSRLLQVLEGGFRGDYDKFHRAILKLMPESQTPNHWVVGRKDPAFDAQHPFEI